MASGTDGLKNRTANFDHVKVTSSLFLVVSVSNVIQDINSKQHQSNKKTTKRER